MRTTGGRQAVVIVEDDKTIGRLLDRALKGNEYGAVWCHTGGAGLVAARREQAEVVLLDLGLPDLDGIDVTPGLRAEFPELLMILTARGEGTREPVVVADLTLDGAARRCTVVGVELSLRPSTLRGHGYRLDPPPEQC